MSQNLSELTTLKIGGPAKKVITVTTEAELIKAVTEAVDQTTLIIFIGTGSNLLVSDQGVDAVVIKNEITGIEQSGNTLIVKSGTNLQDLVDFANDHNLAGLQKLAGIPGTVGGAIYGNAGAYGQTISDHLFKVRWYSRVNINEISSSKEECLFGYRDSKFKHAKSKAYYFSDDYILEAEFELTPGNSQQLKKESSDTIQKREAKYPPGIKCPGSFFKNIVAANLSREILEKIPADKIVYGKIPAGTLLELVGAKGDSIGDIEIAPYHANLFVNKGHGTAKDFWELAKKYSDKVYQKFHIRLEPEVQFINLQPLS